MDSVLEFHRAYIAQRRVSAHGVVDALDVRFDDDFDLLGHTVVRGILGLERAEEALAGGVVVAVAGSAPAAHQAVLQKLALVVLAGVLTASVGVMDQARRYAAVSERMSQGL